MLYKLGQETGGLPSTTGQQNQDRLCSQQQQHPAVKSTDLKQHLPRHMGGDPGRGSVPEAQEAHTPRCSVACPMRRYEPRAYLAWLGRAEPRCRLISGSLAHPTSQSHQAHPAHPGPQT